ncbi:MAG: ATP-binding protein [Bryobacterales bacterium]|nr:ATP-binding protein [Bryobacterales bacterium]
MDFEKLGVFYLGRHYDLDTRQQKPEPLLYDSRDLVTHAVCVGMTGSGKTGLCISLLEEAAIDGIPALIIDPKGDLSNLLLTFPDLRPEDFAPWVNLDDAARKGIPTADFPRQQAELWATGLAKWGQSGERIRMLRNAAEFAIYTPGSNAGIPVCVLRSFDAPTGAAAEDRELYTERIQATATSLLGLLGIEADPIQSREHILLSNILDNAWRDGASLELGQLIQQVQSPPFERVGVLELETFYPSKDRMRLAMQLNNLLASPGFSQWMEGVPLDIGNLLYTPQGKPRVAILSIAHLSDAERMFVVSLVLNNTLAWMRQQAGTTSLRAILYMDEIFGYFPPVSNPPSKMPLLTLLKQARAFGLGVVLATQNPVDLDYKGLSNAGTWFIGRLQTERDKERVLEGLEGASTAAGGRFDRGRMEQTLAGLGSRVFLMNNVHDDAPTVFETRWAMSYLRGPLTRQQIKQLAPLTRAAASAPSGAVGGVAATATAAATAAHPPTTASAAPITEPAEKRVIAVATIRFSDTKTKIDEERTVAFAAAIAGNTNLPKWDEAEEADESTAGDAVPANLLTKWQREYATWLANSQTVEVFRSAKYKVNSQPGESERDFRLHLQQLAREERDREVTRLRAKYAPKIAVLEDRAHRAEAAVQREQEQASQQKMSMGVDIAKGVLGVLFGGGRKSSLGGLGTAAKSYGRTKRQSSDVDLAAANLDRVKEQLAELQAELEAEVASLQAAYDGGVDDVEAVVIRPKKTAIQVKSMVFARG